MKKIVSLSKFVQIKLSTAFYYYCIENVLIIIIIILSRKPCLKWRHDHVIIITDEDIQVDEALEVQAVHVPVVQLT